ncbi:MAG: carboxypeptidase regulatory-like domain-containing protein [Chloroflexi bacterium]|nr:carboxypeptidase regulatory-like domain-containing protein [Chloroflexota bacterium]
MAKLTGKIIDPATGASVQARVQVLSPNGNQLAPADAMWKVGSGEPFFYSNGEFSLDVPRGRTRITVERGTEYRPWTRTIDVDDAAGTLTLDIELERWADLPDRGWHPGNTHIHYDEKEEKPDERLAYDSRVEDLRMTAVSILRRWDLNYATNKYPIGVLNDFTDTHHHVQVGEENRHNDKDGWSRGYGHVMFLNIRNIVDPISRGALIDSFAPDYPPLSWACDDAKRQDGLVIWCHNGQGMEAPVAAALGKVDAINLFDPYWNDVEYDLWYRMLNCGLKLPASTGSDWFVCSANRIYSQTGGAFSYDEWLAGIRRGETFITNGPAISLSVDGAPPGATVPAGAGGAVHVRVDWSSHYAVETVEIVHNGEVVRRVTTGDSDSTGGSLESDVEVNADGWIAARLGSSERDSFAQALWAHTSPVYIDAGGRKPDARAEAAALFVRDIEESMAWVKTKGRFYTDAQRAEVVDLFRQGQDVYRGLM